MNPMVTRSWCAQTSPANDPPLRWARGSFGEKVFVAGELHGALIVVEQMCRIEVVAGMAKK